MRKQLPSRFLIIYIGVNFLISGCHRRFIAHDQERGPGQSSPEELIAGSFLDLWYGTHAPAPSLSLSVLGDEMTSSFDNFGMHDLSNEPRAVWNNSIEYDPEKQLVNRTPWYSLYSAISCAGLGLLAIADGITFIDPETGEDNTPRGEAFARFVTGAAYGFLGCFFDQGFIVDMGGSTEDEFVESKLRSYPKLIEKSMEELQRCADLCAAHSFMIPWDWIHAEVDQERLSELAHSYAARFLVSYGRSIAERDAADWCAIKSHGEKGISDDFFVEGDGDYFWNGYQYYGMREDWVRADCWSIGPSDTSGNFDAWVATPVADRTAFIMYSPDKRLCSGDSAGTGTFLEDGTDFSFYSPIPFDASRGTVHFSWYMNDRYLDHFTHEGRSPMPDFLKAEIDFILAECALREGNAAQAATLINNWRVTRGGLPSVSGATPTGTVNDDCDAFTTLWAILKYEKGIELWATGVGRAYFDKRGWGDLITNTPVHFPIPARELETLQMDDYTFGGGGPGSAPKMKEFRKAIQY